MERLIDQGGTPVECWKCKSEPCDLCEALDEVTVKLRAYEDTGMEPEEVSQIRGDIEAGLLKQTAIRYGIPVDRLRELAQADREGRMVVLPCKRGDTVWRICGQKRRKFVAERTVQSVTMYDPGQFEIFTNCPDWLGNCLPRP